MIVMETDLQQADGDANACWELASSSEDPMAIGSAHIIRQIISWQRGELRRYLEQASEFYEWSIPQGTSVTPSCHLAGALLHAGDLVGAESVVRTGLSASWWAQFEAIIRLHAGVLAVRQGATEAARSHVARAEEIRPHLEEHAECEPGAPIAEVLLAEGDPTAAFELVERVLPVNAVDVRVLDELMVWGARAAADVVQQALDDRDQTAVRRHREALTRLMKTRTTLPGIMFQPSCPDDTIQPARAALFAAEHGRAEDVDDQVSLWRGAAAACDAAGLGWEEQVSSWRLAAALIESGASGTEAAELLRVVHDYAAQQGAGPLKARVEELAASARISLATPRQPPSQAVPTAFAGLTAREREVLSHLVANRTNAEIGKTLFISEKTVSVHVSNLLRKTDTGSRREVAALARRVGLGPGV
jgi:DNA-binding CsgD family transcriptional regulator